MTVILLAAVSTDGFIAAAEGQNSFDWTSKEDKAFFVSKTKEIGTIVMGWNTFKTIGKGLKGRRMIVLTQTPDAVAPVEGVEFVSAAPADLVARLAAEGVERVAICGGAYVYAQFLNGGLVNEAFLTVEPVTFGSGTLLAPGFDLNRLELVSEEPLGPATLKRYRVR